jgi:hypothetical protein
MTRWSVNFAVKSDGKVVSHVSQQVDTKQDAAEGATAATHVQTEVEVPSQGIHRTVVSDSQQDVASVERRNNVRKMVQVQGCGVGTQKLGLRLRLLDF